MGKKVVKKRKIKKRAFLILFLIIGLIALICYLVMQIKITNILILNNTFLTDDYIINKANIKDYPSVININPFKIEEELKKELSIKDVNVSYDFFMILKIDIEENKPLYINSKNEIVFEDNEVLANNESFNIPTLMSELDNSMTKNFTSKLSRVSPNILSKISSIKYVPNEFDKERFLCYMDDGNLVYITLTKIESINYYNDFLEQLENKLGILYLDSGNHFEIKG